MSALFLRTRLNSEIVPGLRGFPGPKQHRAMFHVAANSAGIDRRDNETIADCANHLETRVGGLTVNFDGAQRGDYWCLLMSSGILTRLSSGSAVRLNA